MSKPVILRPVWPALASNECIPLPVPVLDPEWAKVPPPAIAAATALLFRFARLVAPDARVVQMLAEWTCVWTGLIHTKALTEASSAAAFKTAPQCKWHAVNHAGPHVFGQQSTYDDNAIVWSNGDHVLSPAACIVAALCWVGASCVEPSMQLPLPSATRKESPVHHYFNAGRALQPVPFLTALIDVFLRKRQTADAFGVDFTICSPAAETVSGSAMAATGAIPSVAVMIEEWYVLLRQIGHTGTTSTDDCKLSTAFQRPPLHSPTQMQMPAGWSSSVVNVRIVPLLLANDGVAWCWPLAYCQTDAPLLYVCLKAAAEAHVAGLRMDQSASVQQHFVRTVSRIWSAFTAADKTAVESSVRSALELKFGELVSTIKPAVAAPLSSSSPTVATAPTSTLKTVLTSSVVSVPSSTAKSILSPVATVSAKATLPPPLPTLLAAPALKSSIPILPVSKQLAPISSSARVDLAAIPTTEPTTLPRSIDAATRTLTSTRIDFASGACSTLSAAFAAPRAVQPGRLYSRGPQAITLYAPCAAWSTHVQPARETLAAFFRRLCVLKHAAGIYVYDNHVPVGTLCAKHRTEKGVVRQYAYELVATTAAASPTVPAWTPALEAASTILTAPLTWAIVLTREDLLWLACTSDARPREIMLQLWQKHHVHDAHHVFVDSTMRALFTDVCVSPTKGSRNEITALRSANTWPHDAMCELAFYLHDHAASTLVKELLEFAAKSAVVRITLRAAIQTALKKYGIGRHDATAAASTPLSDKEKDDLTTDEEEDEDTDNDDLDDEYDTRTLFGVAGAEPNMLYCDTEFVRCSSEIAASGLCRHAVCDDKPIVVDETTGLRSGAFIHGLRMTTTQLALVCALGSYAELDALRTCVQFVPVRHMVRAMHDLAALASNDAREVRKRLLHYRDNDTMSVLSALSRGTL